MAKLALSVCAISVRTCVFLFANFPLYLKNKNLLIKCKYLRVDCYHEIIQEMLLSPVNIYHIVNFDMDAHFEK